MGSKFLISLDISKRPNHFDLGSVAYLKAICIRVSSHKVDEALNFIRKSTFNFETYCDCREITNVQSIFSLLEAGSKAVLVKNEIFENDYFDAVRTNVPERIIPFLEETPVAESTQAQAATIASTVDRYRQNYGASLRFCLTSEAFDTAEKLLEDAGCSHQIFLFVNGPRSQVRNHLRKQCLSVIPEEMIDVDFTKSQELIPISDLMMGSLRQSGSEDLIPTVVVDERGVSLGLVYSNKESIENALETGCGVYYSRSRKRLWKKGETSGNVQELVHISIDCDADTLQFKVRQKGEGFCHLATATCFGPYEGLSRLETTLKDRKQAAPKGSYTHRLFHDPALLQAKIMEEAMELCEAQSSQDIGAEAADLIYFALTKCISAGVNLTDVERILDQRSLRISRRAGNAKSQWASRFGAIGTTSTDQSKAEPGKEKNEERQQTQDRISMRRLVTKGLPQRDVQEALQRPSQRSTEHIMGIVQPIIDEVRKDGDEAVLKYTIKFEKATSLVSPTLQAPFPDDLMRLPEQTVRAIDISFENILKFHDAQKEREPLRVETMPGVTCSRFCRPIDKVGLYVPGGTAVLPSTALMLGVPAMVAGCRTIILASPPRENGTVSPEIIYIAKKIGAQSILLAGGAQAVAALAYGTESIKKVDKILGPGNQFVTAAKMLVANDTTATVSIDMPAGPSEVLVIADETAIPSFVAADLLSQAEHGADSQVVLIAIDLPAERLTAIEDELDLQAAELPRKGIVKACIEHSVTLAVENLAEALTLSNQYAPEHLILQIQNPEAALERIENAGSVFIGNWTPESVGDYSAGVNHSLPTYGYAKQYSGVNLASFTKNITSSMVTKDGLRNISFPVTQLADVEGLEAHKRAVTIRLDHET